LQTLQSLKLNAKFFESFFSHSLTHTHTLTHLYTHALSQTHMNIHTCTHAHTPIPPIFPTFADFYGIIDLLSFPDFFNPQKLLHSFFFGNVFLFYFLGSLSTLLFTRAFSKGRYIWAALQEEEITIEEISIFPLSQKMLGEVFSSKTKMLTSSLCRNWKSHLGIYVDLNKCQQSCVDFLIYFCRLYLYSTRITFLWFDISIFLSI